LNEGRTDAEAGQEGDDGAGGDERRRQANDFRRKKARGYDPECEAECRVDNCGRHDEQAVPQKRVTPDMAHYGAGRPDHPEPATRAEAGSRNSRQVRL